MVLEEENVVYCTAFGCFFDYQHSVLVHSTLHLYSVALLATASSVCAVLVSGETR